jgi:hypothetical protein
MTIDHNVAPETNPSEDLSPPVASPPSEDPKRWPTISDEMLVEYLAATQPYTIVILRAGPNRSMPGAQEVIWEHGRRNLSMRVAGLLPMIFPVAGGQEVCGVGIFNADPEAVGAIMAQDPAVQAGTITYDVYPTRSFPGDTLPKPSVAEARSDKS